MKSHMLVTFSFYSSCLWLIFSSSLYTLCLCDQNTNKVQCIATERLVLTELKNSLVDRANRLSSWSGKDCCCWSGVVCDNLTHHVQELHLRGPDDGIHGHCHGSYDTYDEFQEAKNQMLGGTISRSLIKLEQLRYLDLSCNHFGLSPIPSFIGSFHNMRYLNISNSRFSGEIPHFLGNLSSLVVLDVHDGNLRSKNLKWIKNLKQLQYLNMDGVNLTAASSDWLQAINNLRSLQELHFSSCGLTQIPNEPTRVSFTSLTLLDLSHNIFYGLLPGWVFGLRKLITLDLTGCLIGGLNPTTHGGFATMPLLRSLRVSQNSFVNTSFFLNDLSSLTNLRYLDVSNCDLYDPILDKLHNLSLIVHLDVSINQIVEEIPKSLSNLCNMTTLALYSNKFFGDVSGLLEKFCECESPKLESLVLRSNDLDGRLPEKLGRLKYLAKIDITNNRLTGIIPRSISDLSSLEFLDVSYNEFNGSLPRSIGKLGKLRDLSLDHNSLTGIVTENHFAYLTSLNTLSIGNNKLAFDIVNNWTPPFNLYALEISFCNLGPLFPSWIQSQTNMQQLNLANANISDTIPIWIWSTFPYLLYFYISHNNIVGKLGDVSTFIIPGYIGIILDLSSNHFHGKLPRNFSIPEFNALELDLSSNNLSGSLDQFLCSAVNRPRPLRVLNLGNNNISGGLPDCWMYWEYLDILNLENNKLSGKIPPSLGNMTWLESIDIRNNKLPGKIQVSLLNSNRLVIVKLAYNEFTGRIRVSVGRSIPSLQILSLRSNKLHGEIPNELCRLSSIQILDLANNNLSGNLPKCFTNFSFFSGKKKPTADVPYSTSYILRSQQPGSISLVTKGQFNIYSTIVFLVTTLDLSNNKLSGSIPNELVSLSGLRYLNLSHNKLIGRIPNTFDEMRELESLDLSTNHLQGTIPLSLAGLTALNLLNVSYNNLTGTIPIGHQLQTFNEFSFIGNSLCGAPLPGCQSVTNGTNDDPDDGDDDDGEDIDWILVICIIVGLTVGFWMTIGMLIVNKKWRYAYYGFLDKRTTKLSNLIFLVFMSCKRVKF